ncbi:MAG: AAA family ATPase [archaeon]
MILILIGKPCSGKTTARKYLENKYAFKSVEASDYVKKQMTLTKIESIESLFEKLGRDFVARNILDDVQMDQNVLISGFRTLEEVNLLKEHYVCIVVGIHADDRTCFERSKIRLRIGRYHDFSSFYVERICRDYSLGLAELMADHLDFSLYNSDSDLVEFYSQLDKLVGDIDG